MPRHSLVRRAAICVSFAAAVTCAAASARAEIIRIVRPRPVLPAEKQFQQGLAALDRNDLAAAEAAFKASLALDGKAAAAYMGLSMVALRRGQKEIAETNMKQAIALAPDSASIQTSWGTYLYSQRDLPAAEAALRKAISLDSRMMAAHLHLGDMYLVAFRKPQEAIREYRAAVLLEPGHAGAHYALGLALLANDQAKDGEAALLQASRFAPDNPLPLHVLGRLYAATKQFEKALGAFEAALKVSPKFAAPHYERAQIFAASGNDERALQEYAEVQRKDPGRSIGYLNIGMVHQRNRRWAEAEAAYLSAVKVEPKNSIAYNNLAWMAAERRTDLKRAHEWASKAVAADPKVAEFRVTLGWVYRAQGDLARAEQTLRAAAAIQPQRATAYYYLGRVCLERGRKAEAIDHLKKALAIQPDFVGAEAARTTLKELGQG